MSQSKQTFEKLDLKLINQTEMSFFCSVLIFLEAGRYIDSKQATNYTPILFFERLSKIKIILSTCFCCFSFNSV